MSTLRAARHKRWICCVAVVGFSVCAVGVFVAGEDPGGTGAAGLCDLLQQFKTVASLSYSATVEIEVPDAAGRAVVSCDSCFQGASPLDPILGYFEYTASGDRYKVVSFAEPDRYPGVQTQVAFDGQRFQLLLPNGTLSYSAHDSNSGLPTLPDPMFQLLQFCYPLTDANTAIELRLKDVQSDTTTHGECDASWVPVQVGTHMLDRAVLPGGTYEGVAYVHHVYVQPSGRNRPVRIDRIADYGRLSSTEFSDYIQVDTARGPTFWPLSIVFRMYDADGAELIAVFFEIHNLTVDAEFPRSTFAIDPAQASRIWDGEQRAFVPG